MSFSQGVYNIDGLSGVPMEFKIHLSDGKLQVDHRSRAFCSKMPIILFVIVIKTKKVKTLF